MSVDSTTNCLFCKIVAGSIPAKIAYQDDQVLAFHDIAPAAPVHILIIPRQHIDSVAKLDESNAGLIAHLILTAAKIAREQNVEASGYRLVTSIGVDGGQSVPHLHFHLLAGRKMTWPPG